MTDYEVLRLLWNKNVRIGLLRYSFTQVELWDGDIDYGLETYNEEICQQDKLTEEEYINIYNYVNERYTKTLY